MTATVQGKAPLVVNLHRIGRRGKYHLSHDGYEALCGVPGFFPVRGQRAMFEEHCPEKICKHCRVAEASR